MSGTKVDLETLRAAIKEYESIRDELIQAEQSGKLLTTVQGAGLDMPSKVYANYAVTAGQMHQQSNKQLQTTLTTRIDNLKATLQQYEQTEQGNEANMKPKD
ncbi:PE domain-containing protein [Lentzea sp. NPDC054927]